MPEFNELFTLAKTYFNLPDAICLYWLKGEGMDTRKKMFNQESYDMVRQSLSRSVNPEIYIWSPQPTNNVPDEEDDTTATDDEESSEDEDSSDGNNSDNDDDSTDYFFESLLRRDKKICNLCDNTHNLEAGFIIPEYFNMADIEVYGIYGVYDIRNGILLCNICHKYLDLNFWYVDDNYKVIFSNVLFDREDTRAHFEPLRGCTLKIFTYHDALPNSKPTLAIWKYRQNHFQEAKLNV